AFAVASVSGAVLAVCSCTVLPLFAGIYAMGAGLGPAATFLYSGPAINVLAIIFTARVLGAGLAAARAVAAILSGLAVGLLMGFFFRRAETSRREGLPAMPEPSSDRPAWRTGLILAVMLAAVVLANWARAGDVRAVFLCCPDGLTTYRVEGTVIDRTDRAVTIRRPDGERVVIPLKRLRDLRAVTRGGRTFAVLRWLLLGALLLALAAMLRWWTAPRELGQWIESSWGLARQILPLMFVGILAAGLLLGRPGHEGIIPARWVQMLLGRRPDALLAATGLDRTAGEGLIRATWPLWTNLAASLAGALMYFATLTEVPILDGLLRANMGKGPALALLLAGPAVSLPNMLVIRSVIGTKKTLVFVALVVMVACLSGMIYGAFS
ncbi:MAG: permease, partial [Planctomycetes bacterium]|nr:permease [Planctomycetota bacterium]